MVYVVATCILESREDPRWHWAQSRQPVPVRGLPVSAQVFLRLTSIKLNAPAPADLMCHVVAATGTRLASFYVAP
jgi:hypothetical protein